MPGESARKDTQQGSQKERPVALLFELENSAVEGRRLLYDVFKKLLKDKDVELTPVLYLGHCQKPCIETCITALLEATGKKRLSAAKLAAEVAVEWKNVLADKRMKMPAGFQNLLEKAKGKGAAIGALTALPRDVAEALVKRLGLDSLEVRLHPASKENSCFPTADAWLKLAKVVGVPPQGCTVLTTSAASCKAALSGGMKPVTCPDEFTEYQDFGGADLMLEKLNEEAADTVVALMVQSRQAE